MLLDGALARLAAALRLPVEDLDTGEREPAAATTRARPDGA